MTQNVSEAFTGRTIYVDSRHFVDCEFLNCTLIYAGGELPIFTGSHFEHCEWRFEAHAKRTIEFLKAINANGGHSLILSFFDQQSGSGQT